MGLVRSALLAGSQSVWLRDQLTRRPFFRRSVSRFMPGERLDDALEACRAMQARGIATLLTCLGENVTSLEDARATTEHYVEALSRIAAQQTDSLLSVKLTQLGLDLGEEGCLDAVRRLVERAAPRTVWIDMEASDYVEATLAIYRRVRSESPNVGLCLQAYLHRTPDDLEALLPLGPSIRLVKGAYSEAPAVALARKRDLDARYLELAERLLSAEARATGTFVGLATHDDALIARLRDLSASAPREAYEFEMLYGIRTAQQRRLVQDGRPVRVLISYGSQWFPWYMRRLAERPANVWFVLKNLW